MVAPAVSLLNNNQNDFDVIKVHIFFFLLKQVFMVHSHLLFITVRKRSCGKVMFLHLSHPVHREGVVYRSVV